VRREALSLIDFKRSPKSVGPFLKRFAKCWLTIKPDGSNSVLILLAQTGALLFKPALSGQNAFLLRLEWQLMICAGYTRQDLYGHKNEADVHMYLQIGSFSSIAFFVVEKSLFASSARLDRMCCCLRERRV
jgi:hypothetical protein